MYSKPGRHFEAKAVSIYLYSVYHLNQFLRTTESAQKSTV